ncbi:hypothetical protein FRB90_011492 [Tulasnella sp. 427]|nr:hypothetical protein FRB90_011492 [Tulasnella sp. 427]
MDHLGGILQHQLATDASSFEHTPIVLQTLTAEHLKPSQHSGKWMARINSLLHSREPSLRWTGLCLAYKTSELSMTLMLEHAEVWVGLVLPMLSKPDVDPIYTLSIRLLLHIFSSATHMTEFQRQVSMPNVPRFASALVSLAEKDVSMSLKITIFETLRALLGVYPSVLRSVQAPIYKLALRHVSGSFPTPTAPQLVSSVSILLAGLHLSSGKIAASAAWKKTMEAALTTAHVSLEALRTSYSYSTHSTRAELEVPKLPDDPMIAVPLALDRLRCMMSVISALSRTTLTSITTLLSEDPSKSEPTDNVLGQSLTGRGKGKKRARGYEGDELLRSRPPGSQLDAEQSEEIIAAVDVLEALIVSGFVSQPTLSTIHRVLLSVLLLLSQQTSETFSKSLRAYGNLQQKVFDLTTQIAMRGKDGFAARSLGAVLSSSQTLSAGFETKKAYIDLGSRLESTLHPRLPPLLKTAPPVESFPLFKREKTKEEREILEELRVDSSDTLTTAAVPNKGIVEAAVTISTPNRGVQHDSTAPQLNGSTIAAPIVPQPPIRPVALVTDQLAQSVSMSLRTAANPTGGQPAALPSTSKDVESGIGAHTYEKPDWAVLSDYVPPALPQPSPEPTKEEQLPSLRVPMDHDDDEDQPIPEIDMRSDTEDEE